MNLHQFRFVDAAVRNGLNLTAAAKSLNTSQPGVSKAIIELENELGIQIFVRHGKRIKRVTEPGQHVVDCITTILREVGNLRRIGAEYQAEDVGTLSIATTHSQARYVLPRPVAKLRERYPQVNISMHQGTPAQVAQMVTDETVDIGIATEALADFRELITLPCYEWEHVLIMPVDHPLAKLDPITLEAIAEVPLVTYDPSFTGRKRVDSAFEQRGLSPQIALEAIDSDVIKTYVRLGLGVGIVAEMAVDADADRDLVVRPLGTFLGQNIARIALKRDAYLRDFVYYFAELLSSRLDKALIQQAMSGEATDYGL